MTEREKKIHIPLPKETRAFICANCGAVALDMHGVCKPQGRGRKMDWCGIKDSSLPQFCHNRVNNVRYSCDKCGKVAVNSELLCEPTQMGLPPEEKPVIRQTGLLRQILNELRGFFGMRKDS